LSALNCIGFRFFVNLWSHLWVHLLPSGQCRKEFHFSRFNSVFLEPHPTTTCDFVNMISQWSTSFQTREWIVYHLCLISHGTLTGSDA